MDWPTCVVTSLGDPGGSAYYRIVMPVFMANQRGMIQLRMPQKMFFYPLDYIQMLKPDTMLFHRSHTDQHRKYMHDIAKEDIFMVYTIDDWVGKVPKESPHYGAVSANMDKDIKKAIGICDKLIVTNDVLAGVYGYKKDTYIIPNYLTELVWNQVYQTAVRKPRTSQKPRIGWSGGIGHPGDLKILREIADILGDEVQWVFLGDTPPGFDQGNSEVHNAVPPPQYPKAIYEMDLDIALAPLLDNDFNRAKSNLRILEYSACGYPVLASNVEPYKDCPVTLLDYTAKWWATEIRNRLEDREALQDDGIRMKEWVWKNFKMEAHLVEYANILAPDGVGFVPSEPVIEDTIDVVITTRNNKKIVTDCVDSVLESLPDIKNKVEVVVTDNASTEPGMQDYLKSLESKGVTVLYSDQDYGYIRNVNNGLKLHPNRDAIILNSDTLVYSDWVDRLRDMAYKNDRIASVTPFTNNGTIVSYPNPNPTNSKLEPPLIRFYDSMIKSVNYDSYVELPTPVGFCTFLKRTALADLGLFDHHAYGRGYGDENDWALRSQSRAWKNILGHNVYIGHAGSVSFGGEKKQLMEHAAAVLLTRFPHYDKLIQQWMSANPINIIRQHIDITTIEKTTHKPRTLYIAHGYGGGLETYVQEQLKHEEGAIIFRNDPQRPNIVTLEVQGEKYYSLPEINTKLSAMGFLTEVLKRLQINKISVQTTFGYDYTFPIWIMNLADLMGLEYEVMIHDYFTICPRLRLVQVVDYCGEPPEEDCNQCVKTYGSAVGQVNVGAWRDMYSNFLATASRVMAPSKDTAKRIQDYYVIPIDVVPHEPDLKVKSKEGSKTWKKGEELRVAVIGNISPDKGSLIIRDCAQYCYAMDLPIKFVVFGNLLDNTAVLTSIPENPNLKILGSYEEANLENLLRLNPCHISFMSSLWPETWSYTLSHALKSGLWPVAFDIGAPAERIRDLKFGTVIPYDKHKDIPYIVDSLYKAATEINDL